MARVPPLGGTEQGGPGEERRQWFNILLFQRVRRNAFLRGSVDEPVGKLLLNGVERPPPERMNRCFRIRIGSRLNHLFQHLRRRGAFPGRTGLSDPFRLLLHPLQHLRGVVGPVITAVAQQGPVTHQVVLLKHGLSLLHTLTVEQFVPVLRHHAIRNRRYVLVRVNGAGDQGQAADHDDTDQDFVGRAGGE